MKTVQVIGLPLACTDYAGAIEWIFERARRSDRAYAVEAANTHVASLARSDKRFGKAMEKFDLICPDGMPLVWAMNRKLKKEARILAQRRGDAERNDKKEEPLGQLGEVKLSHSEGSASRPVETRGDSAPLRDPLTLDHCPLTNTLTDRVYGPNLMLQCIEASKGLPDLKHFLLGGAQSTLDELTRRFGAEYPETQIAGYYSPPFGDWPADEFDRISDMIRSSGANMIWVGLGCPKQETWIADNKERLPAGVYFGIGAAFAFHAGEVKQAPKWMQNNGLEWAYRIAAEPRRLLKRYLVNNSRFLWYILTEK